jgi:hypothetical protein
MHLVGASGIENKRERQRERDKERALNTAEYIQSKKAWYEAVMQSETKPKGRGSSDNECIQSKPPPKPPFSEEH